MINLLPHDRKRQLQAARSNVLLVRYNVALVCVIAFLGVTVIAVNLLLSSAQSSAIKDTQANQAKVSNFASVQSSANNFRSALTKAKGLLATNVDFAKLVTGTANLMPAGTILTTLKVDQTNFGKPMVLNFEIKGQAQALALRDAFSQSSLYSNVSFGQLSINSGADAGAYPFTIDLNVTPNEAAVQ